MRVRVKRCLHAFYSSIQSIGSETEIRKGVFDNFRNSILIAILLGISLSDYLASDQLLRILIWVIVVVLWVLNVYQYYFEVLRPLKLKFVLTHCSHIPQVNREKNFAPVFRPLSFFVFGLFTTISFEIVWVVIQIHTYDKSKRKNGSLEVKMNAIDKTLNEALVLLCAAKKTPSRLCDSKQSITAPTETLRFACTDGKQVSVVHWADPQHQGEIVLLLDHDVFKLAAEDSYRNKFGSLTENIKWERTTHGWSLNDVSLSTPVASGCNKILN